MSHEPENRLQLVLRFVHAPAGIPDGASFYIELFAVILHVQKVRRISEA